MLFLLICCVFTGKSLQLGNTDHQTFQTYDSFVATRPNTDLKHLKLIIPLSLPGLQIWSGNRKNYYDPIVILSTIILFFKQFF